MPVQDALSIFILTLWIIQQTLTQSFCIGEKLIIFTTLQPYLSQEQRQEFFRICSSVLSAVTM